MICPHCKYTVKKKKGEDFFYLPTKMERYVAWEPPDEETVFGCPKCGLLFMRRAGER